MARNPGAAAPFIVGRDPSMWPRFQWRGIENRLNRMRMRPEPLQCGRAFNGAESVRSQGRSHNAMNLQCGRAFNGAESSC